MLKKLFFTLLCSSLVYGEELNEKFEILANKVKNSQKVVEANGNVVIFSPTYYITAKKALFNKEKNSFELFGDVTIVKNNSLELFSNYAYLDLNSNDFSQSPALFLEKNSNLWMNSSKNEKKENDLNLFNSILSSCDCEDPDWSIKFSEGSYNIDSKWVHTYNTRLYIGSVPIFYTPYFGFPTDKSRRSGLLIPTIGFSNTEGTYYSQPIFIAPRKDLDIELIPQIRTIRGAGLYTYFRYADSPSSMLKIKSGYFQDKKEYQEKYSLENEKHYGYNIEYKRENIFTNSKNSKDGLFVDIEWLNDVEYKNLEDDKIKESYSKTIESKINYFYNTPKYYTGLYLRHYLDTEKSSNSTTLQQLPELHLHSFTDKLIEKINYSTDFKFSNFTRKEGITATKYDFKAPIFFNIPLFNDYFNLTLKEEFEVSKINYKDGTRSYEDGTLFQNRHIISLSSDLIKPYKDFLHSLNFTSEFVIPNTVTKQGDLYGINNTTAELSNFAVEESDKILSFSLNQSLYDKDNLEQIINHKIKQSIIYDEGDTKLSDLENELTFTLFNTDFNNRLVYSNEDKSLVESSSKISYENESYFFNVNYYSSKNTPNSNRENLESYSLETGVKFLKDYKLSYKENFNLEDDIRNKQAIIFNIDDKCWNFNLKYEKEIVASSSTNSNSIEQEILFFNIEFKPLGGVKQKYKIKESN